MDHFDLKHEASTTVKAAVECSGEVKGRRRECSGDLVRGFA